ncbi:hypothetical protein E4T56_gene6385, partial [Termitomyces sp. T112]
MSKLPARSVTLGTCLRQRDFRICPKRQFAFYAINAIFDAPKLATTWIDQQIKPLRVGDLVWFILGLRVSDRGIGQHHWGPRFPGRLPRPPNWAPIICAEIRDFFNLRRSSPVWNLEARAGIEPAYTDLQSAASPLRHRAIHA